MKLSQNTKKIDPVCGREISPQKAIAKIKYGKEIYYLCCPICLGRFSNNPEKYIKSVEKS